RDLPQSLFLPGLSPVLGIKCEPGPVFYAFGYRLFDPAARFRDFYKHSSGFIDQAVIPQDSSHILDQWSRPASKSRPGDHPPLIARRAADQNLLLKRITPDTFPPPPSFCFIPASSHFLFLAPRTQKPNPSSSDL